ncbi:MAG TPA: NAD(P)H nitroreductase [Pseudonocardiaceae bacterium]|jgi:nitroreductase|nr:NAD(P)H nitroreductase [Pseudonocardiaceae bacterium]
MRHFLPDDETVRSVIALALRAPSIHNSQPWRWVIGDNSVHLLADPDRQLPITDPDSRDLFVSCGAALHHARVAFAAVGWATTVHRLPNPAQPDHLATLECFPRAATAGDIALAAAISHRRTDRRRFSSWAVPVDLLDTLTEHAAAQGTILVPISDPQYRFQLTSAIADAARQQAARPEYASELAAWAGRGFVAIEGVPAANTLSAPARHGDTTMRAFPPGELTEPERWEGDAGELLVLATSSDDRISQLRAGEALSAVLLAATELHLATCPLTQPVEIGTTRAVLRDRVLDGAAFPQMVLRVGWAPVGSDPLPTTPRRPLDDVLSRFPD